MSVEAIGDSSTVEEFGTSDELSSTWNGRDVRCQPLDEEAAIIRALAFAHLVAQKEGVQAVRKLEQTIYALGPLDDELDSDLPDPEINALIEFIQTHAWWTAAELLMAEERVQLLLNDPTRPGDLLILHKSVGSKVAKVFRQGGRNTRKGIKTTGKFIKKHKKPIIATVVVAVAVAVTIATGGTAAAAAAAGAAAAAAAGSPAAMSDRKREENEAPTPPRSSSVGDPPFKPLEASELHIPKIQYSFDPPKALSFPMPPSFSHEIPHSPLPPVSFERPALSVQQMLPLDNHFIPTWKPQQPVLSYPPLSDIQQKNLVPPIALPLTPPNNISSPPVGKIEGPPISSPPSRIAFIDPDGPPRIYEDSLYPPKVFEIPGTKLSRGCIGGINGMGNNLEGAKAHANYLSQLSSNHHVEWVHNRSNTILLDIVEVITLNYRGISAPAKELKENWLKFHEKHKNDPDAKYLQLCHSQGALHVRNALQALPKEIRDRIIVVAIAPACVVPKELCFASFNYASKGDIVPYLETAFVAGSKDIPMDAVGERYEEAFKELIRLDPHPDATGTGHDFESPTFKPVIERHLKEYINQCGSLE